MTVGPCTVRSMLNKFEHVGGSLYGVVKYIRVNGHIVYPPTCGQKDRQTGLKTLPLRWLAVKIPEPRRAKKLKNAQNLDRSRIGEVNEEVVFIRNAV